VSFSPVVTVHEGASLAGNESSEASFTTSAAISVDARSSRFMVGFDVIGSAHTNAFIAPAFRASSGGTCGSTTFFEVLEHLFSAALLAVVRIQDFHP
jgi:hypothetical protein